MSDTTRTLDPSIGIEGQQASSKILDEILSDELLATLEQELASIDVDDHGFVDAIQEWVSNEVTEMIASGNVPMEDPDEEKNGMIAFLRGCITEARAFIAEARRSPNKFRTMGSESFLFQVQTFVSIIDGLKKIGLNEKLCTPLGLFSSLVSEIVNAHQTLLLKDFRNTPVNELLLEWDAYQTSGLNRTQYIEQIREKWQSDADQLMVQLEILDFSDDEAVWQWIIAIHQVGGLNTILIDKDALIRKFLKNGFPIDENPLKPSEKINHNWASRRVIGMHLAYLVEKGLFYNTIEYSYSYWKGICEATGADPESEESGFEN